MASNLVCNSHEQPRMASDLVCFITGGASGLGRATALRLGRKGAKVVIADLPGSNGAAVAVEIGTEVAFFHPTDVTNPSDIQLGVQLAVERFGKINVLVNCAGITSAHGTLDDDGRAHSLDLFKKVIDVNLTGTFNAIRIVAEEMAKSKIESGKEGSDHERGVIINTASISGFDGGAIAYAASKAGVIGMTLPIARDLAEYGIRVNSIAPGCFVTPMTDFPGLIDLVKSQIPFPSRPGQPEEFAHLVEFLIENRMINGETIRIDGAARLTRANKSMNDDGVKNLLANFARHAETRATTEMK